MVTLVLTEKGGDSKQLMFDKDEVTVGRVQGNDVVLPKGNVSKRHCRILLHNGRFSVEDMKSTNGTYINGRKIGEPTFIGGSDKIYVGDFVIRIENAGAEGATSSPGLPEAGSLSTALPRRPPPPPAPGRATMPMRSVDDDEPGADAGRGRSSGRSPLPPPPPPPPLGRRDTARPQPSVGDDAELAPPSPSDVDLDEEALSARPRLSVPPLKSALASLMDDDEVESADEVPTANRDRAALAAAAAAADAPYRGDETPPPSTGAPDAVASWLRDLLVADGASAVYVNGSKVEVERQGHRTLAETPPGVSIPDALRSLASRGSPRPSGDTRVVNVMLPENARLAAIFPPVASEVCATLQKLSPLGTTLTDLASAGALSNEARSLIEACLGGRRNILLGGDGRAAHALLQAVASAIPGRMRVVCLVDDLTPPAGAHWTRLASETRVSDIVYAASSLRPDYLVLQLTAPPLAADVLTQCVLGQEGTIVSVAARSARDAVHRMAALAGPALGGIAHVQELTAAAFDLVVCASTLGDGSLRVLEIGEPNIASGELAVHPLVTWKAEGSSGGKFQMARGASRLAATLTARGVQLPHGFHA
jgi:pilus assembly protein CpaF